MKIKENSLVSSTVGKVERHKVIRLIGASQKGGSPDLAASRFLTEAGFIPERGRDSDLAYLGARPQAGNVFLDLAMRPGKRRKGDFKLVKVGAGGETVIIESGQVYDLDKTRDYLIVSGNGQTLIQTQIVADLNLANGNGQDKPAEAPGSPPSSSEASPAPATSAATTASLPKPPEEEETVTPPPLAVLTPNPAQPTAAQVEAELRVDKIEPWPDQPRWSKLSGRENRMAQGGFCFACKSWPEKI